MGNNSSGHKQLSLFGVDFMSMLALLGAAASLHALDQRGATARQELANNAAVSGSLEKTLTRNIAVSQMEGQVFPAPLAEGIRQAGVVDDTKRILVVAYTPTVCLTCLFNGLESLSRRSWSEKGILIHALVGERDGVTAARERALILREEGRLPQSISFVPMTSVDSLLFAHLGKEFAEEPIYLLLSPHLIIQSAFHADQRRPELLELWLDQIR